MAIKIVLLKSGEQLITDVMGMFSGENLVKYQLNKPCQVVINGEFKVSEKDESSENKMSVSLYPWPTLSKDESVEITFDWVYSIVEPTDELKKMYENRVLQDGNNTAENDNDDIVDE